jgi:hypothetical protein
MNALEKLLSISSEPFVPSPSHARLVSRDHAGVLEQVESMLTRKNGFAAFESALIIFPTVATGLMPSIDSWNDLSGWRRWYRDVVSDEVLFFADDLFGGQFGASKKEIIRFDPEQGRVSAYATTLLDWAARLLANYREHTAWPLAHEWQVANGPIGPHQRLLPKQPFILGGDYTVDNMRLVDRTIAMENWGRLFQATRRIPDGELITVYGWLDQRT